MWLPRLLVACLAVVLLGVAPLSGQTPPPPQQQTPQSQPQPPTTTVVGADGKLVSLIFRRADAENVTRRVYRALLERDPNAQEFDESVAELQRGRLAEQVGTIVQTSEFTGAAGARPAAQLLDQIFQGMLDRSPTAAEVKTFLPSVQAKQYAGAMVKLVTSTSFRAQAARDRVTNPNEAPRPSPQTPPVPVPDRSTSGSMPPAREVPPTPPAAAPLPGRPPTAPPSTPTVPASPVPATPAPIPAPVEPERPALKPAPFPVARSSEVSVPAATPPALTPEWARVLACQDDVVRQLRAQAARQVFVRFDAAEISATTVRGSATDAFDERRLTYRCSGGATTYTYADSRPRRASAAGADFAADDVRACHAAVTDALRRQRRGAAVTFETAGKMPTDTVLYIRGAGTDSSGPGQPQPFTYQCQSDGGTIVGATFSFGSR